MTLGVWFKTYIFYPVSVSSMVKKWNKFGRKHLGKYLTKLGVSAIALFPVWLLNGLWHGSQWNYIFYGMYYFVILLGGIALEPVRSKVLKRLHADEHALYWRIPQVLKTWIKLCDKNFIDSSHRHYMFLLGFFWNNHNTSDGSFYNYRDSSVAC